MSGRDRGPGRSRFDVHLDLTDGDAVDALVEELLTRHGAVDYLVNNAGRSIRRSLELSHDRFHDFERMMAVNFFGPVRLTMGLLPAMREQKFGHVVNIVTWGNQIKAPKFAAYIASKTALDVFGRIMGREAFFDNVTCTNVRVALVATDMIGPTEAYSGRRAESPEHCAERIVRALEDRPITVNGIVGTVSRGLQPRHPAAGRLRVRRDVAPRARLGRRPRRGAASAHLLERAPVSSAAAASRSSVRGG